jgi:hypothetical protein
MATKQQQPITPQQAHYVIQRLLAARAVSPSEISRYLSDIEGEVRALEERLRTLRLAASGAVAPETPRYAARPLVRRRRTVVAKGGTTASQRLQGSYIGHIRKFPKAERGKYSAIAKQHGREAAIKRMRADLAK